MIPERPRALLALGEQEAARDRAFSEGRIHDYIEHVAKVARLKREARRHAERAQR